MDRPATSRGSAGQRATRALLAGFLGISCATFAEPPVAPVSSLPIGQRPSAYLEVSIDAFTVTPRGRGYLVAPWGWPSLIEASLVEEDLFSVVSREDDRQDLRVAVEIEVAHTPMSGALLCVLTGFLIPANDHRTLAVSAAVHDRQRSIDTSARARHEFRTWLQLFLLPLWLTHDPGAYEYDSAISLSTSAVSEALAAWAASLARQEGAEAVGPTARLR
jgi:hypothetical protein